MCKLGHERNDPRSDGQRVIFRAELFFLQYLR